MEPAYSRIEGLFSELRARGFRVTPEQMTAVTTLILKLTTAAVAPISNQRLGRWIGPLVCRSAEEQIHFPRVFEAWFPDDAPAIIGESIETRESEKRPVVDGAGSRHAEEQLRRARWRARLARAMPSITGSVALLIVLLVALSRLAPVVRRSPAPQPAAEPTQEASKSSSQAAEHKPSMVTGPTTEGSDHYLVSLVLELHETVGPLAVFVVWLPMVALILIVAASRHVMLAYVRREQLRAKPAMRDLLLHGYSGDIVSSAFTRDVQVMRRRLILPSRDLDVDRTIDATAAAARLTPICATRLASPDYLVLIDRRTGADHFAAYGRVVVRGLESAGVHVATYHYDRDMRRIVPLAAHQYHDLSDFAFVSETARLVMFGDGEALVDMNTGRLHDWAYDLEAWPKRVLLTPKPIAAWSRVEHMFGRDLGLQVFPATEAGAKLAASYFAEESAPDTAYEPPPRTGSAGSALAHRFAVAPFRWVHDEPPAMCDQHELIGELREYLSPLAMLWLSAVAVYPDVYWALTLHIGAGLQGGDGAKDVDVDALEQIASLPWLRYGRIPDWLRAKLIQDIEPADVIRVAEIMDGLFLTVLAQLPKNLLLEIGTHGVKSVDSPDQHVDRIMLEFMERRQSAVIDYAMPRAVAQRLQRFAKRLGVADVLGQDELRHMEAAAAEYQLLVAASYPSELLVSNWNNATLTPEHGEVAEYRTSANVAVGLPAITYAVRRGQGGVVSIVDAPSFQAWERQRVIALRLSIASLAVLSLVFATIYSRFFSERMAGGVAFGMLCVLLYVPVGVVWLVTVRRFSRALDAFPTVSESILKLR